MRSSRTGFVLLRISRVRLDSDAQRESSQVRQRPGDATSTLRLTRSNGLVAAVTFPVVSAVAQMPLIASFLARAKVQRPRAYAAFAVQKVVVFVGHAAAYGLAVGLHGAPVGVLVYGSALGVPALAALWGLMFTNYVQHVDCDPASRWRRSRDFVSSWMNFFVFDNGFHTVHHEQAGLHWSQTRAAHARIAHLLDPRLQERSIFGYALRTYVLGASTLRPAPRTGPVRAMEACPAGTTARAPAAPAAGAR